MTASASAYEDDFNLAVDDMLSDMYEQLFFLNTIRYETDNLKVLQAFDRCMFNIHGIRMPMDIFTAISARKRTTQKGGDVEDIELNDIRAFLLTNKPRGTALPEETATPLFEGTNTVATLYSEYEQYAYLLFNLKRMHTDRRTTLVRITALPRWLYNYVVSTKLPERPDSEVFNRLDLLKRLKILEALLEGLNAEEMEKFDYKRKYDGKTVIIDKDGAQEEIPDEEAKPRAGAGAGAGAVAGAAGMPLGTRPHNPTLPTGWFGCSTCRRTYKNKNKNKKKYVI